MKYLVYGVFRTRDLEWRKSLRGVGRQPVFLVSKNGLSAAVSNISEPELIANLSGALAYEKVIESIHRYSAVIPLRYGAVFEGKLQIVRFLEEHSKHHAKLLRELDGSAEMSVRVLLESTTREPPLASSSGAAYLAARRERYAREDKISAEQERISRGIKRCLAGLFARTKTEVNLVAGRRSLSLYFLVPRNSVVSFRRAFHRMAQQPPAKFLSGPWPPHNFVS